MDLKKAARVKSQFEALEEDDRALVWDKAQSLKAFIDRRLAALPDSDKAVVTWLVAEVLATLCNVPLSEASDKVYSSMVAYGVLSVDFLGWFDQQPPSE